MSRLAALLLLSSFALSAQDRVSPEFMYHRVWAVVPMVGAGTDDDPKRPMFAPSPAERRAEQAEQSKQGKGKGNSKPPAILGYSMQLSDDGKSALVEFVAPNPESVKHITESKAPGVKVFERGSAQKDDIEAEFKKHKANFKLESFGGRAK